MSDPIITEFQSMMLGMNAITSGDINSVSYHAGFQDAIDGRQPGPEMENPHFSEGFKHGLAQRDIDPAQERGDWEYHHQKYRDHDEQ